MLSAGFPWLMAFWSGATQLLTLWTDRRPLSKLLLCLEGIVLMGAALGPPLIATLTRTDSGALSLEVSRGAYEFLVLGLSVLFWCGWCEGGYRLGQQISSAAKVPWQRRLTLELWTGIIFSLLLSVLTSLSGLLPLVAVFLLFGGIESLRASSSGRTLWSSILRGFSESFRLVSLAPLRLLSLLVVPGFLLYTINLLLRILQICFRDYLSPPDLMPSFLGSVGLGVAVVSLGFLGLVFFFVARMDLAITYLQIQGATLQLQDPRIAVPIHPLEETFYFVRRCGRSLVLLLVFWMLLYGLYEVISLDLFSRNFFYLILETCVGVVNGFVQSFFDLLAKFAFIIVVIALILALCVLLVSLAKGNVGGVISRSITFLGDGVQRVSQFIGKQINLPGQAIQVTTLLSAVGLIATQTYTRIVEAQGLRLEQQKRQEQLVNLQVEREKNYDDRAEEQINSFQKTLQSFASKDRNESGWLDLDLRGQVASLTRGLTRQLINSDGHPDGIRRGRVLRYLYDSRFLIQNEFGSELKSPCRGALSTVIAEGESPYSLLMIPQLMLDMKLTDKMLEKGGNQPYKSCQLARLIPLNMDFSYSSLREAFLNNASVPFINLSHADLRNAQLRNADLRFANLKDANLRSADLSGAKLDYAYMSNADLTGAIIDPQTTSFKGAVLFYSTHDKDLEGSLTWALTKQKGGKATILWCPLDPRMDPEKPTEKSHQVAIPQAGSKCNNRSFSGYKRRSNRLEYRNWASGDFSGTTIENFRLNNINFTNANLSGAFFKFVQLTDIDFTGANLEGAHFEDSVLSNVNFTGADIRKMVLKNSSVERLSFRGSQYVLPIELGGYADELLLLSGRKVDLALASDQSPPARLAQKLLQPLLLAPFPLRPSRVLLWLFPYSPELLFATANRQALP